MDKADNAARGSPGGEKMKKIARPDTSQDTVVIKPVLGIVQVQLAIRGIAVQIHHAVFTVRVLPEMCKKPSRAPLLEAGRLLEADFLELNRIWDLEII